MECSRGAELVVEYGVVDLALVVDGSFATSDQGGGCSGHGGAGLVLVRGEEILASRACSFQAASSSDSEFYAVIRAARWAPGVPIYTDARELPVKMARVNPRLVVHYLGARGRRAAYVLAHRLSIEGRCRRAPETTPRAGIEFAAERPKRSKAERRRMGAELLLVRARQDPRFSGDFTIIARQLGWTSGPRWQDNPAIRIAAQLWWEQLAVKEEPKGPPDKGAVPDTKSTNFSKA